MTTTRASTYALAAGAVAGLLTGVGLYLVHSPLALVAFAAAAVAVLLAGSARRLDALRIAVTAAALTRALGLLIYPPRPLDEWLVALMLESLLAAGVALRWPVHGLALLCVSTALHRWRVVEMTWRIDELPLAIAYSMIATAAIAWSIATVRRSRA